MNKEIIENLFEFWTFVGESIGAFIKTDEYNATIVNGSDWPNRIFNVNEGNANFDKIINLSRQNLLPDKITLPKPNNLGAHSQVKLFLPQRNMALTMRKYSLKLSAESNIKQVLTEDDAEIFADTASASFGYKVDPAIVHKLSFNGSPVKMFIHKKSVQSLGCGIVFFDSNNNAGLHMIGTIPTAQGLGIGTQITTKLLDEVKAKGCNHCVLNASKMGEPLYKKLGFQMYGELETYRIE